MKKTETNLKSTDNITNLNIVTWLPEEQANGIIQIEHGITEHVGRYEKLAKFFTEKGYLYTSTHVFMNKNAFTNEKYYKKYSKADLVNYSSKGIKPFYILSHSNIQHKIVPTITKREI